MANEGSIWVEGTEFHFVDGSGTEYKYDGDYVTSPSGADPGSIWIDGENLHYIDENGDERKIPRVVHSSVSGTKGSIWIEDQGDGDQAITYVAETG
ncbi:MAG: hypothetical protein V5A72_03055, partial [Candidatus Nanohaloarchaea archaeon]